VNEHDLTVACALEANVPLRTDEVADWSDVLRRANVVVSVTSGAVAQLHRRRTRTKRASRRFAIAFAAVLAAALVAVLSVGAAQGWWFFKRGATVPYNVFSAVNGRVVGWAPTGHDWFAVFVDRRGSDWCHLKGTSWRMALVETKKLPVRVVADRRISGAMCGNELAWVRAGRFSDGQHREVAFMLWATPSLGATTSIYRIEGNRFTLLARIPGDRVVLGRGTVTVHWENPGRSPHGELEDVYRFSGGAYRLQH
jgi:hypothetical protein